DDIAIHKNGQLYHKQNYKHSFDRRAKFTPVKSRGEFGSFFIAFKFIADKQSSTVGCRSPPYQSFLKTNKNKIDMEEK
ncbi:MAG: hypothetical protein RR229_08400, partial [Oscillospiraceae bacterium]